MTSETDQEQTKKGRGILSKALSFLLTVVIIGAAITTFVWFKETKPKAKKRSKVKISTVVEVERAMLSSQPIFVEAMGVVGPAKSIALSPLVSGEIIEVNPQLKPGTYFLTGEKILKINPVDYTLLVKQQEAEVAAARNELTIEFGNQLVAQREFELLGEQVSEKERNLMLRKPQLENLQATLKSTKAKLEQAKLDLSRTQIIAPFNGVVTSLDTNLGARVNAGSTLINYTGVDEFWIEVSIPVSQLRWITIPKKDSKTSGSHVRVFNDNVWPQNSYRKGEVVRLLPGLEPDGRMARIVVRVDDPLAQEETDKPPLLLDSYVRVEIDCGEMEDVIAVDRKHIRNGNQLWVIDQESKLDIRQIEVLFTNREKLVLAEGLSVDEYFITSPIPSPVPGMKVAINTPDPSQTISRVDEKSQNVNKPKQGKGDDQ